MTYWSIKKVGKYNIQTFPVLNVSDSDPKYLIDLSIVAIKH